MEKIDKLDRQILNIISKNAVFRVLPFINGYNA